MSGPKRCDRICAVRSYSDSFILGISQSAARTGARAAFEAGTQAWPLLGDAFLGQRVLH